MSRDNKTHPRPINKRDNKCSNCSRIAIQRVDNKMFCDDVCLTQYQNTKNLLREAISLMLWNKLKDTSFMLSDEIEMLAKDVFKLVEKYYP